jgi:hypothetical protein
MLKSLDSGLRRNDALKEFQIFYEIVKFLFRSAWTLAASGGAYMKLQKLELVLSWATLHFVGWVEPTPDFVGFRCTQPNLHIAGVIAKGETQQRPISKPSPKSFYLIRLAVFLARGAARVKLH